ncbi:flagellar basal body L-ring protein FlgH [Buchnera aphidicola (Ceratoglyphina bambusae)]|uniref:flagellar basal body L-ring protein FlgH n=1 Tax=Buchnera aphidicola TaxID=9 RepID=UPI0031B8B1EB
MKNKKFIVSLIIYILLEIFFAKNVLAINVLHKQTNLFHKIKQENDGSIFKEQEVKEKKYGTLLDQHKKYNVGDLISVIIQENTVANNKTSENVKRYAISTLGEKEKKEENNKIKRFLKNFFKINQESKNNLFGAGQNFSENFLSGIITVTVEKVLPNENLLVYGNKNVIINKGNELIKFSGIINPDDIRIDNKVISTNIANMKIECLRNDYVKDIQKMGWWQRFILHIIPI